MSSITPPVRITAGPEFFKLTDGAGRMIGAIWFEDDFERRMATKRLDRDTALAIARGTAACIRDMLRSAEPGATDADVDEVVREFRGDPRKAIAALLDDLDTFARDAQAMTSRGYVRGRFLDARRRARP